MTDINLMRQLSLFLPRKGDTDLRANWDELEAWAKRTADIVSVPAVSRPYATYVVGNTRSHNPAAANADHVVDGDNDASPMIQAALNACVGGYYGNGGEVLILDGTYTCNSQITVPWGVKVRGTGQYGGVLYTTGAFDLLKCGSGVGSGFSIDIEALSFRTTGGGYAIDMNGGEHIAVRNCIFSQGNGIKASGYLFDISHNYFGQVTTGIYSDGGVGIIAANETISHAGIWLDTNGMYDTIVIANRLDTNTGVARTCMNLVNCSKCFITGNLVRDARFDPVVAIDAGCAGIIVVGNDFRNGAVTPIANLGAGTLLAYPAGVYGDNFT